MKNIKEIIIALAVLFIAYLVYDKFTAEPEILEVPVEVVVEVPGKPGKIIRDTTYVPVPVEVTNPVNDSLLQEYTQAKDSLEQLKLFKDAIKTRIYNEKYDDETLTVDVKTTVQGKMLNQGIEYFVKPQTIVVDTTIQVAIPKKINILAGAELGLPLTPTGLNPNTPNVKFNVGLQNKKGNILNIGIDTQGNGYVGYTMKLFSL